jgi:hypothetical protein
MGEFDRWNLNPKLYATILQWWLTPKVQVNSQLVYLFEQFQKFLIVYVMLSCFKICLWCALIQWVFKVFNSINFHIGSFLIELWILILAKMLVIIFILSNIFCNLRALQFVRETMPLMKLLINFRGWKHYQLDKK